MLTWSCTTHWGWGHLHRRRRPHGRGHTPTHVPTGPTTHRTPHWGPTTHATHGGRPGEPLHPTRGSHSPSRRRRLLLPLLLLRRRRQHWRPHRLLLLLPGCGAGWRRQQRCRRLLLLRRHPLLLLKGRGSRLRHVGPWNSARGAQVSPVVLDGCHLCAQCRAPHGLSVPCHCTALPACLLLLHCCSHDFSQFLFGRTCKMGRGGGGGYE